MTMSTLRSERLMQPNSTPIEPTVSKYCDSLVPPPTKIYMVYYTCLRPVKSVRNYDSIATYSEHLSEVPLQGISSKVLVNLDMCSKIVLDLTRRILTSNCVLFVFTGPWILR